MNRALGILFCAFWLPCNLLPADESKPVVSEDYEISISQRRGDKDQKLSASTIRNNQWYFFEIKVTRVGKEAKADGLTLKYCMMVERGQPIGEKLNRDYYKLEVIRGELPLKSLELRKMETVETKPIDEGINLLRPGWYYPGGGSEESKDELVGIMVRLYDGDTLISEISDPTSVLRKYDWTTGQLKK